eukprot:m.18212 g.18212  ORF g.18212 m.18212 type:complete len:685 (-) comp7317_c0_seq1:41-2095(-)
MATRVFSRAFPLHRGLLSAPNFGIGRTLVNQFSGTSRTVALAPMRVGVSAMSNVVRQFALQAKEPCDPATLGTITLHQMLEDSIAKYGPRPMFGTKQNGKFVFNTYESFGRDVQAARGVLKSLGVKKGTTVAIISANRPSWAVGAYATYGLGGVYVPMYEQQQGKECAFIIRDSGASVVLVSTKAVLNKIGSLMPETVKHVLCFDDIRAAGGFEAYAKQIGVQPCPTEENDPNQLACLIYTSGTSGNPKGVMLTHKNIKSNVDSMSLLLQGKYTHEDRHLSFLPWAHIYGQSVELHGAVAQGASLACAESRETIVTDLPLSQPTVLVAVPTLFDTIIKGIREKLPKAGAKRKIFDWALRVGKARRDVLNQHKQMGPLLSLQWAVAKAVVFQKIYDRFGGRLRHATSGGSALATEIQDFFGDIGIPVLEGYGLTETSPVVITERYGPTEFLQGGMQPLPGTTVYLCPSVPEGADPAEYAHELPPGKEGELCVSGPGVMQGYYNNPTATAQAFFTLNGQRVFRTGDLACFFPNGSVKITGRVKELYKLRNGKYVVPSPIEEAIRASPYVLQVSVYGENRPFNIVIIVPHMARLAATLNADEKTVLTTHAEEVKKLLQAEVDALCRKAQIKSFEQPHDVLVLGTPFTQENGMMTGKTSLRRSVIFKNFAQEIDAIYAKSAASLPKAD